MRELRLIKDLRTIPFVALAFAGSAGFVHGCGSGNATGDVTPRVEPPASDLGEGQDVSDLPSDVSMPDVLNGSDMSVSVLGPMAADTSILDKGAVVPSGGFQVKGRHLYDKCGEKVVLRGINEMVIWSAGADGVPEFAEIAKTGANAVRIVWRTDTGSPGGLAKAIANALDAKLIPIPELHDATGNMGRLPALVDYWTRKEVLDVLSRYRDRILINIGNEVGDDRVPGATWEKAWIDAVARMRRADITIPLIIDAPRWGQDIDRLQESGPKVLAQDPLRNLIFSVHMWWTDGTAAKIEAELQQSVSLNLPLIVGEFGPYAVHECPRYPFDYAALMAQAQAKGIGWLAWSWGAVKNRDCPGLFDMTKGGTFETLEGWGRSVAVSDPNSIQKTARRPALFATGSCRSKLAERQL